MEIIILTAVLLHLLSSYLKSSGQKNFNGRNTASLNKKLRTTIWLQDKILRQIIALAIIAYVILPHEPVWLKMALPLTIKLTGLVLVIISPLIKIWSYRELGKNWSTGVAIYQEHSLITTGPYRLVRHPVYLSYGLLALGAFLITGSLTLLTLGFAFFAIDVVRSRAEEKALIQKFKDSYLKYQKTTGAYLPRLSKTTG
jgi:protein-S-isoprenylcysteine O-methyltransferase Ste14